MPRAKLSCSDQASAPTRFTPTARSAITPRLIPARSPAWCAAACCSSSTHCSQHWKSISSRVGGPERLDARAGRMTHVVGPVAPGPVRRSGQRRPGGEVEQSLSLPVAVGLAAPAPGPRSAGRRRSPPARLVSPSRPASRSIRSTSSGRSSSSLRQARTRERWASAASAYSGMRSGRRYPGPNRGRMAAYNHTVAMPSRKHNTTKMMMAPVSIGGRLRAASCASIRAPRTGTFRMVSLMFITRPAASPPLMTPPVLMDAMAPPLSREGQHSTLEGDNQSDRGSSALRLHEGPAPTPFEPRAPTPRSRASRTGKSWRLPSCTRYTLRLLVEEGDA